MNRSDLESGFLLFRSLYLLFSHKDQPGALTKITYIAGKKNSGWCLTHGIVIPGKEAVQSCWNQDGPCEFEDWPGRLQPALLTSNLWIMLPETCHAVSIGAHTICRGMAILHYEALHLLISTLCHAEQREQWQALQGVAAYTMMIVLASYRQRQEFGIANQAAQAHVHMTYSVVRTSLSSRITMMSHCHRQLSSLNDTNLHNTYRLTWMSPHSA